MNLGDFGRFMRRGVKENSPVILSVVAGIGTLTTAYLAGKASFQAANIIRNEEEVSGTIDDRKQRLIERTKLVWKLYIPTGISATSTIACIVGANRLGVKKTIAAQTAVTVLQQTYSEYRDKVIEEFGERKDQSIRDKIAEERVKANPPSKDILIVGSGAVLCCELHTERYFSSDMETLRKAQNDINVKILSQDYATLSDFYYLIGLRYTTTSSEIGWKSSRQMELQFTSLLTEDNRPCLAFEYNYTTPL